MMKKLTFVLLLMIISQWSFSQNQVFMAPENCEGSSQPISLSSFGSQQVSVTDNASIWALPTSGGTSTLSRAPHNMYKYQRTEYLITQAEMAASGLTTSAILTNIAYNITTAGTGTLSGTLNIYLMNTANTTYTLGTSWTIAGFTQVYNNASYSIPITAGVFDIPITPFTYTGQGLYVAWEFNSPTGTVGTVAVVHDCNSLTTGLLYGGRSTASMPTALTVSAFRPATRFTTSSYDEMIGITNIYATEKVPTPYGTPSTIGIRYSNTSTSSVTFDLTLTVKDQATSTVRYTSTQTGLTIAAGSSATASFPAWSPTLLENVYITASTNAIPGETWTFNNTRTISANVNNNLYGYNYTLTPSTGYGFPYNSGGIFANKYMMNGQGSIPSANLFIYNYAANTGRTIYAVVLNSAGTIVAQSADLIIAAGDLGTNKSFTFPTPAVFDNEIFYVGLAQSTTGATVAWYPMGAISESPQRGSTFYTFGLTGGTPSESANPYKYMIEAQVAPYSIAHDVGTLSIDDVPSNITAPASIFPKATVKNFGTNTETFDVTLTTSGYTSTKTVTGLEPSVSAQVTFDEWTPSNGQYTLQVCTGLVGDLEPVNDCKTKNSGVYSTSWAAGSAYPTTTYLSTGVGYTDNSVSPPVGYLYSFGGNTTSALGTESYKYNTNTDTWSPIASLPTKRVVSCSAISGNNIYIIGGSDGTIYTTVVYKYDIVGDAYSTVAPLPVGTAWCKAVAYGSNYIYLAGGNDGTNTLSTVYVYNIALDTWTAATSMPGAKFGGAFSVSGNTLVYVGGSNGSSITNSVYVGTISDSDPTSISWAIKTPYPGSLSTKSGDEIMNSSAISTTASEPGSVKASYPGGTMYRFDAAPWGTKGIIFAAGSPTSAWTPADPNPCYVYKPTTDTWTKYPDLTIPVLGPSLGTVDLNNGGNHTWKIIVASGLSLTAASSATQILSETMLNEVTFNVDMTTAAGFVPGSDLVYIAGDFPGATWNEPGTNPNLMLTQVGSSLIYSITMQLPGGTYSYKYFKNTGWGGGEWPGGANRSVSATGDVTVNNIWGGDVVQWANLQWPDAGTITVGGTYDVYARAYINQGITGVAGGAIGLTSWIGISTSNTDPSTWTTWIPAPYFGPDVNNDEFKAEIGSSLAEGTYYYASRFQLMNGTFVYGGYNGGFWDGSTNISGVLTVNPGSTDKTLNLTAFLEGLYDGANTMRKAQDDMGDHFAGTVADQITVELHNELDYLTVEYQAPNVDLNTDGTASVLVPATYSGMYWLTIKHRNSVETTSSAVVDFSGATISYDFTTTASQAYGDNMKDLGEGVFGLFVGDANQDGLIDGDDLVFMDPDITIGNVGYLPSDLNGDGLIDGDDLVKGDANFTTGIALITP